MDNKGGPIGADELPATVVAFLRAHEARDLNAALSWCAPDAVVVDEGRTYRGHEQIRDWLVRSASEYTYTVELTRVERTGTDSYLAVHHLEGDFPGGVVDLNYRFDLRDGLVARLVIEP